jgi:glutamate synthase (NADPH/NADH) large chain
MVKVMPRDYKAVLQKRKAEEAQSQGNETQAEAV